MPRAANCLRWTWCCQRIEGSEHNSASGVDDSGGDEARARQDHLYIAVQNELVYSMLPPPKEVGGSC